MDNATHCNDIYLNIIRYTITNNCYKTIQLCIYIYIYIYIAWYVLLNVCMYTILTACIHTQINIYIYIASYIEYCVHILYI